MATFESSLKPRLIYVFAIADNQHEGSLKIGETTLADNIDPASTTPNSEDLNKAAKERIDQSEEGVFVPSMISKCIMF